MLTPYKGDCKIVLDRHRHGIGVRIFGIMINNADIRGETDMSTIEISRIDTGYETFRLKDKAKETVLLKSILNKGIREPLRCITKPTGQMVLLDGYKRWRCAVKLGMGTVPVISLGSDEVIAILELIRASNAANLNILEQSMLVDELNGKHRLGVREIACRLECSPAWVSVRLGIIGQMSAMVKEEVFAGRFPVRSYMYTLRVFTRVNSVKSSEIDIFVKAVSGKGLSARNIDVLAYAFFGGGADLRKQIREGNIKWTLKQLRQWRRSAKGVSDTFSGKEKHIITDLGIMQKQIRRVTKDLRDPRLKTPSFSTAVEMLIKPFLKDLDKLKKTLEVLHDR